MGLEPAPILGFHDWRREKRGHFSGLGIGLGGLIDTKANQINTIGAWGDFKLTAGADNRTGTAGNDSFDGSAGANNLTPNTLNSFDTIDGGNGTDRIIVAQNIADSDFQNTKNVEGITTSGRPAGGNTPVATSIVLGGTAQAAGITSVESSAAFTILNLATGYTNETFSGNLLSGIGVNATTPAFTTANTVLVNNKAAGSNFRVNFVSAEAGNGVNTNASNDLALTLQREDGADALVGGVSRFSDEGVTFASTDATVRFDVRGLNAAGAEDPAQNRGSFQQVTLGSQGADVLTVSTQTGVAAIGATGNVYINGGEGNDVITGGASNDFLVGGNNDDQLVTGGGRDTVLGGAGNDGIAENVGTALVNVNGGAGDDSVFVVGGALAATGPAATRDTLTGGDGTDTLIAATADLNVVTAVAAGETATITGFETIRTDGTAINLTTANVQAGITGVTLDLNGASGTINFEAGERTAQVGAEAFTIGAVTSVANGQLGGLLTVNAAGTAATDVLTLNNGRTTGTINVFNTQNVTAGGYETLNIGTGTTVTAGQTLGTVTVNASAIATNVAVTATGSNALSIANLVSNSTGTTSFNASTMTAQNVGATLILATAASAGTGSVSVTGSTGSDNIRVNGRGFVDAGAGNDTVFGSGLNDTLLGGAGNDGITIGTGNDSVDGGAGNDTVSVGAAANLTGDDTLAGGEGRDHLDVSGGGITAGGQVNISGFEVLSFSTLLALTTQDMIQFVNNPGFDTIRVNSTAQDLTIQNAGAALLNLSLADDRAGTVTTFQNLVNTNSNVLNVAMEASPTPNVATARTAGTLVLDNGAGAGTDTLNVNSRSNAIADDRLTINGLSGSDLDTINVNGLQDVSITAATLNGTARNITVNAVDSTGANFTFNGSAAGSNAVQFVLNGSNVAINTLTGNANSDTINGGSVADVLVGGAGGDVINGNGGNDNITGGAGRDTINGGDGIDTYVYVNAAESTINDAVVGPPLVPAANAFDIVTVSAGDIVDVAPAIAVARAAEFTILGAASTDAATLLASLNTAFQAADDNNANVEAILVEYVTGGRQFLLVDLDNNQAITGADQIIEIVGSVNTLTLSDTNVAIS